MSMFMLRFEIVSMRIVDAVFEFIVGVTLSENKDTFIILLNVFGTILLIYLHHHLLRSLHDLHSLLGGLERQQQKLNKVPKIKNLLY